MARLPFLVPADALRRAPTAHAMTTTAALLLASLLAVPAGADVELCKCYCGVNLRPPCGDEACKRACGYREPASSSSGGGGGGGFVPQTVGQAAAMGAAAGFSGALSNAISNWITGNPAQEAARRAELARQAAFEAEQRRLAEEAKRRKFEAEKGELLRGIKGAPKGELGLKGAPGSGELRLKDVAAPRLVPREVSRRQTLALACALLETARAFAALGADGAEAVKALQADAENVLAELAKAPGGRAGSRLVLSGGGDFVAKTGAGEGQLVAKLLVMRDDATGEVFVSVMSSASDGTGPAREAENLLTLDRHGTVVERNLSPEAEACLRGK